MAIGNKPGIDAAKKLPSEGFKRACSLTIKTDKSVRTKLIRCLMTVGVDVASLKK